MAIELPSRAAETAHPIAVATYTPSLPLEVDLPRLVPSSRPWPDLAMMRLPPLAPAILAASLLGLWLPEFAGLIALSLAASLIMVFAILGLAVLHAITRGTASRPLMLAAFYVSVIPLAGMPLLFASLLGLAESVLPRPRAHCGGPAATTALFTGLRQLSFQSTNGDQPWK